MTDDDETPIACTLSGADFEERVAWIARLNHDGLRTHRREGASLHRRYDAAVRDRGLELIRRESACCAVLGFAVDERSDGLLAPFLPRPADRRRLSP